MAEVTRHYKDENGVVWKGPVECAERVFFITEDGSQERDDRDPSWEIVDYAWVESLKAINNFLVHIQLDITASRTGRARQIAVQAHANQTRRNGDPYITHPIRVARSVEGEDLKVVAFLHDVVEDTSLTLTDLRQFGFTSEQIEAIDSVTKRPGESYLEFVLRAKINPLGCQIKIADIKDNLPDAKHKSWEKYQLALWILEH